MFACAYTCLSFPDLVHNMRGCHARAVSRRLAGIDDPLIVPQLRHRDPTKHGQEADGAKSHAVSDCNCAAAARSISTSQRSSPNIELANSSGVTEHVEKKAANRARTVFPCVEFIGWLRVDFAGNGKNFRRGLSGDVREAKISPIGRWVNSFNSHYTTSEGEVPLRSGNL